jgi:hypothetical protein
MSRSTEESARATANPHEAEARRKKCQRVLGFLINRLADMLDKDRSLLLDAAAQAGVNPPSEQSQELILAMLRERGRYE